MINYILQVILFQTLFLGIYDVFLSKETFFTKNRVYLLLTPLLSFLIPFIRIPSFQKVISKEQIVYLPEIVLNPDKVITTTIKQAGFQESTNHIQILFWIGFVILALIFVTKLFSLFKLIITNQKEKKFNFTLVYLPTASKAFSFFNYIFLGLHIEKNQQEKVIAHELVHSKQKHSFDLLFFEILKIVMWFNPLVYLYQKRITVLHEYISDAVVTKQENKENYINNLLTNFFQVENMSFINQFSKQSLIKKRIAMITKTRSNRIKQLKYLLLLPVLASMLFYTACSNDEFNQELNSKNISKLDFQKRYTEFGDKLDVGVSDKKTYSDYYFGNGVPEGVEVSYDDLTNEERSEFDMLYERFKNAAEKKITIVESLKIYKKSNGRKTLAVMLKDFKDVKIPRKERKPNSDGSYSVLHVNHTPIFPGCEPRDNECFFKKLDEHFQNNFDKSITQGLGLNSGRTKAFVSFNIGLNGRVEDIKVRSPHKNISTEVKRVINSLPEMTVGKRGEEQVKVRYTLPFVFYVD